MEHDDDLLLGQVVVCVDNSVRLNVLRHDVCRAAVLSNAYQSMCVEAFDE
jgi:hypothetical protein